MSTIKINTIETADIDLPSQEGSKALLTGRKSINSLHDRHNEFGPRSHRPKKGSRRSAISIKDISQNIAKAEHEALTDTVPEYTAEGWTEQELEQARMAVNYGW